MVSIRPTGLQPVTPCLEGGFLPFRQVACVQMLASEGVGVALLQGVDTLGIQRLSAATVLTTPIRKSELPMVRCKEAFEVCAADLEMFAYIGDFCRVWLVGLFRYYGSFSNSCGRNDKRISNRLAF